ncbi:hypothetical protein BDV93DRAFT_582039 [Ceratobasidium sp. AG-I]|nr:hypothetical protein BDV93DRAFT_582039 [Ceratobasidium sp. AG-I]
MYFCHPNPAVWILPIPHQQIIIPVCLILTVPAASIVVPTLLPPSRLTECTAFANFSSRYLADGPPPHPRRLNTRAAHSERGAEDQPGGRISKDSSLDVLCPSEAPRSERLGTRNSRVTQFYPVPVPHAPSEPSPVLCTKKARHISNLPPMRRASSFANRDSLITSPYKIHSLGSSHPSLFSSRTQVCRILRIVPPALSRTHAGVSEIFIPHSRTLGNAFLRSGRSLKTFDGDGQVNSDASDGQCDQGRYAETNAEIVAPEDSRAMPPGKAGGARSEVRGMMSELEQIGGGRDLVGRGLGAVGESSEARLGDVHRSAEQARARELEMAVEMVY